MDQKKKLFHYLMPAVKHGIRGPMMCVSADTRPGHLAVIQLTTKSSAYQNTLGQSMQQLKKLAAEQRYQEHKQIYNRRRVEMLQWPSQPDLNLSEVFLWSLKRAVNKQRLVKPYICILA